MKLLMTAGVILSLAAFLGAQQARTPEKAGAAVNKEHQVAKGDTLWGISNKYYGDPRKWGKIYSANTGKISNPDRIYPKDEIEIPEINGTANVPAPRTAEAAGYVKADEPEIREKAADLPSEETEPAEPATGKEPVPATVKEEAPFQPRGKVKAADLTFENLSTEMPSDQKEWTDGPVTMVRGDWKEDGLIISKIDSGMDAENDSLAAPGDRVRIKAAASASFQPGEVISAYMKGTTAYDKRTGKKISLELQKTGTLKVLSVKKNIVEARILRAVTSVDSGQVIKK